MNGLSQLCVTLARLALSAWVGAATLFVINGVMLVTSDAFASPARDHISLIRFPPYYLFGFVAVGIGFVCLLFAKSLGRPRRRWAIGFVGVALLLMLTDYFAVYLPLAEMITPPGNPRTPQFITYHWASQMINSLHVGLCLVAAIIVCRPSPPPALITPSSET